MKKLFISQPMVDRTDEEIFREREKAIAEAKADVAYFAKGWQDYRDCKIEHRCAVDYGIKIILSEFDPHKTTIGKRLDAGLFD